MRDGVRASAVEIKPGTLRASLMYAFRRAYCLFNTVYYSFIKFKSITLSVSLIDSIHLIDLSIVDKQTVLVGMDRRMLIKHSIVLTVF